MPALDLVADGFTFLEGPRWHNGALWLSDFYSHRVLRFDGTQFDTVCEVVGQPSGLGFTPDDDLLVVSMLDRRLLRLHDGRLSTVADLSVLCPGPTNDMVVDAQGRAYVGNDGRLDPLEPTVIVRCDLDGRCEVAADGVVVPNGSVLSPDGTQLTVAETFAARISTWDVAPDGTLSGRRLWAQFGSGDVPTSITQATAELSMLPDGICLDAAGRLWVADAGGSGVWCVEEGGRVVEHIDTGALTAYAVALGGSDHRTLFVCAGPMLRSIDQSGVAQSALLSTRVDVPVP
ncbi:SMP-30/gluconolactonase/LRE family protein [Streptomyces rhizosphaericus]|uniref:SMP-30/gluconolactonase/LRE family protein n=1 Tax=Streptomyces rhizosphaericus TaxID=114699 RepID=A0A6G4AVS8_9ACTN|nr:SMP-30/gluconolactonase/LRE family protein [Streptomyces rhizosphaericus]NEW77372.1 SMP-30/gluconolactonase/LRE family protein [Streptomyces rhizosphaericus]